MAVSGNPTQITNGFAYGDTVITPVTTLSGVTFGPVQAGQRIRTVHVNFTNYSLSLARTTTTNVYGGVKLFDFPIGGVFVVGAVAKITTAGDGTNIAATAPLVWSLGTATAGNDATLTSTEANIIPSTVGTLAASAGTFKNTTLATAAAFAGFSSATACYLNCAGDNAANASATAAGTVTVNGTVDITYIALGGNV